MEINRVLITHFPMNVPGSASKIPEPSHNFPTRCRAFIAWRGLWWVYDRDKSGKPTIGMKLQDG